MKCEFIKTNLHNEVRFYNKNICIRRWEQSITFNTWNLKLLKSARTKEIIINKWNLEFTSKNVWKKDKKEDMVAL